MARQIVAVIGGGCSGVLITRELLRCTGHDVVLIDPAEPGGGLAYGSAARWHLLNSRAGAMSADPDDPGHFVRWANAHGILAEPQDFLSRRDYGRYLREVFDEVAAAHPGRLRVVRATATGLTETPSGYTIELITGAADPGSSAVAFEPTTGAAELATGPFDLITGAAEPDAGVLALTTGAVDRTGRECADHVVLATGNPAGAQPAGMPAGHPAYIGDPWRPGALESVPKDRPVLLIGAGLTAVDVVLSLTAEGTRTAPITAVSRRGQLPLSHTVAAAPPAGVPLDDCVTLRDVVRAVRASAAGAGDWRAVVDGLRPHLDELWVALTPDEQDAFLRHLARPWECHRHRMAPAVATRIAALRAEGALVVRSGGVKAVANESFGAMVNCSGPGRLPGAAGPFLRGLLSDGLVRIGPHELGLDIDDAGHLVAADGTVQPKLWLVGPLRRGARWETTAVPEIRAQARLLARDLGRDGEWASNVGRPGAPLLRAA